MLSLGAMKSETHSSQELPNAARQFTEVSVEINCLLADAEENFLAARFYELLGNRDAADQFLEDWYAKVTNPRLIELQGTQRNVMDVLRTQFPVAARKNDARSPEAKGREIEVLALGATESASPAERFMQIRYVLKIAFNECVLALDGKKLSDAFTCLCAFRYGKLAQSKAAENWRRAGFRFSGGLRLAPMPEGVPA